MIINWENDKKIYWCKNNIYDILYMILLNQENINEYMYLLEKDKTMKTIVKK